MVSRIRGKLRKIETPFYLYDEQRIQKNIAFLKDMFSECQVCLFYAVKANNAVSVLKLINQEGMGAEVVSPGEIFVSRRAGFRSSKILYNNVAKKKDEILYAIRKGVRYFNFEAIDQANLLEKCARKVKKKIKLFVRVNPGIFSKTHSHLSTGAPLSKFGVEKKELKHVADLIRKFAFAELVGIHSHIGSQILTPSPFIRAAKNVMKIIDFFRKKQIEIRYINLGGGFGIPYRPGESPLDFVPIVDAYRKLADSYGVSIFLEPGRCIVGEAGYIVTKVISIKKRNGVKLYIVDADMTENPRPAIYKAYHHIEPLFSKQGRKQRSRIAGSLCENSNEFGVYRLPLLKIGDMLLIHNSGAYTRTMGSNYNGRLLSPEYSVDEGRIRKIRSRQQFINLIENERY